MSFGCKAQTFVHLILHHVNEKKECGARGVKMKAKDKLRQKGGGEGA